MSQKISVSEEGVNALVSMANGLEEKLEIIKNQTNLLKSALEGNNTGLGPHASSIERLIEGVEKIQADASRPTQMIILKLLRIAAMYQQIIENDRYAGGDDSDSPPPTKKLVLKR